VIRGRGSDEPWGNDEYLCIIFAKLQKCRVSQNGEQQQFTYRDDVTYSRIVELLFQKSVQHPAIAFLSCIFLFPFLTKLIRGTPK
jgi:hypothetical protein